LQDGNKKVDESGLGFTGILPKLGNPARLVREYFDSLTLELRVIDAVEASTRMELFGTGFTTPIMVAALYSLDKICPNGMAEVAKGAVAAGAVMWTGIGDESELNAIVNSSAKTVKIIKPYRDHDLIFKKIEQAARCGAFAVGMDVCFGFGMKNGFSPAPMSPKSVADLESFVKASKLPFILKGILSEQDARKALEVGAAGIVVSHQGGTVLDYTVPPARILPRIVNVINSRIPIFVDGGISSGLDAFKAIALGADGVCVGKAVMAGLAADGTEGVRKILEGFTAELRRTMNLTGATDIKAIDPAIVHK
jgi:isopentenyl diphosphate isomerase/L-lactate dehydrogenase-like FMN-dependent dehydrogenase